MRQNTTVREPGLERTGRRFGHSGGRFLLVALVIAIPGIVLVSIGHGWGTGFGIALFALASVPAVIGIALLVSGAVSRWAARHKMFA
jgi:hypothetical protein